MKAGEVRVINGETCIVTEYQPKGNFMYWRTINEATGELGKKVYHGYAGIDNEIGPVLWEARLVLTTPSGQVIG